MPSSLAREIGLLRTLAIYLERRPLPFQDVNQRWLRQEGVGHVRERIGGITTIRIPGHHAFNDLADCVFNRVSGLDRGAFYSDVQTELFNFIDGYVGREPSTVNDQDAEALMSHFKKWLSSKALQHRVFVPCVITPTAAPRWTVGPITFEHVDQVEASDFCPQPSTDSILNRHGFDSLIKWMRKEGGNWLARVPVEGCEQKRAEEVGELAVDLAIVALQLSAPYLDTRSMSRLDARRGTSEKNTLSEAHGFYSFGWTRKNPGMAIGAGTLHEILRTAEPVFKAVGNVLASFTTGVFRLPTLENAWCDAAYWLHQALAESIDTIAMAKLETALEVLFATESSTGSQERLLEILHVFFDLKPDDPIVSGSLLSARLFARNVVRDRSRILHGTWSTLNTRAMDRTGMERFVITVLRQAAIELEAYACSANPADDVREFLRWVRGRKSSQPDVRF